MRHGIVDAAPPDPNKIRRVKMEPTTVVLLFLAGIAFFFVLSLILGSFFTVETAQVAIVQRLGKFARVAGPGLNWKTPFIETVVHRLSMKVQQFDVQVETKTQDNVFVQIPVSIQYKVIPESRPHSTNYPTRSSRSNPWSTTSYSATCRK
jgi:regulator of protease activity HflC (stomatin/prohibitin superfamily)